MISLKNDLCLEETLNGKIGKTKQFRMASAEIGGLIQLKQHAVKISNTTLYSFALFEVAFSANAKSRRKGIMAFPDISTAPNRWKVTALMKRNMKHSLKIMLT